MAADSIKPACYFFFNPWLAPIRSFAAAEKGDLKLRRLFQFVHTMNR
jgi:hypothetical protein